MSKHQFQATLIRYHNSGSYALLIQFPNGISLEQPIFGAAFRELQDHHDIEVVKSHETYDVVMPHAKSAPAEKEDQP